MDKFIETIVNKVNERKSAWEVAPAEKKLRTTLLIAGIVACLPTLLFISFALVALVVTKVPSELLLLAIAGYAVIKKVIKIKKNTKDEEDN